MIANGLQMIGRRSVRFFVAVVLASLCGQSAFAQDSISQAAVDQIGALLQEKETRSSYQQKLDSQLWYALQAARGQALAGLDEVYATAVDTVKADASGLAKVDISAIVSDDLLNQITALGGSVRFASVRDQSIDATVPVAALETLAANSGVIHIAPAAQGRTNVGALTSQGYISHKANQVVAMGLNGTGVKVGVLSDSVDALAALIATGDLPAGMLPLRGRDEFDAPGGGQCAAGRWKRENDFEVSRRADLGRAQHPRRRRTGRTILTDSTSGESATAA